jgi:AAHS family 4-hydroxybenzoate transporter-like MFS transporter
MAFDQSSDEGVKNNSSDAVDVHSFIDERSISKFQVRVVLLCFAVAMVDGFDTQAVAFVARIVSSEMNFGPQGIGNLYSAGLFGLMLGALSFGPLADRIGRKPVVIISCLLMGVFSLMTAFSGSLNELLVFRFLTGLGVGGAMPNINSLTAEYSPRRRQAFLMTLMFAGFPFGAILGGLLSVKLIALYGWPSVFILGGVTPLLLAILLFMRLPESLRYRAARNSKDASIGKDMAAIDSSWQAPANAIYTVDESGSKLPKIPIIELFADGRASGTILIWITYFANLLMMYSLLGWLPTILSDAGLGMAGGIYSAVAFNVGGIAGGLSIAWMLDRQIGFWPISISYLLGTVTVALVGSLGGSMSWALAVICLSGFTLMGGAFAMNAVTAAFYPTTVRSTGLGWGLAIGRLGAIFGPMAIGAALAANRAVGEIFFLVAVPGVFCAITILLIGAKSRQLRATQ